MTISESVPYKKQTPAAFKIGISDQMSRIYKYLAVTKEARAKT